MANSPKYGFEHKLVVGTNDVSYLPTDATPNGTAVLNGPVFIGLPLSSPLPKAVLNVGPPAPQLIAGTKPPLVTPISVWVDGQHTHVGLKIHKGVRTQEGLNVVKGDRITKGNVITKGRHLVSDLVKSEQFIGGKFIGQFQGTINVQSWKGFDVNHPNKEGHRLRHICLEGPEAGVYIRGKTKDSVINLPEYWVNFIDPESITVTLTQIGSSQDLIVERIEEDKRVVIRSGNGSDIHCYYVIHASRIDGEPLIIEYEGETPADYPGSSDQFSIAGWDYSRGS